MRSSPRLKEARGHAMKGWVSRPNLVNGIKHRFLRKDAIGQRRLPRASRMSLSTRRLLRRGRGRGGARAAAEPAADHHVEGRREDQAEGGDAEHAEEHR